MKKLSKKTRMSERRTYSLAADQSVMMAAQLVDIDFYPRMSEETLAFNATLHLWDGSSMYSFDCNNDGHGGCTNVRPVYDETNPPRTNQSKEALRRWKEHLSTQRDDAFYAVAEQMGLAFSDASVVTKSPESEVDNMLAEWCDKHNL